MKKNLLTILRTLVFVLPLSLCFVSCEGFDWNSLLGGDEQGADILDSSELRYYEMDKESLAGWDEGFFYSNESGSICPYYIVSSTDTVNGDIIVCLNQTANADAEKSLIFHFSKEGDVLKILFPGYRFDAQSEENEVTFIVYDAEGELLGTFSVPYIKVDTIAATRSPFFNSKGEFSVSKTMNFLEFGEKVTSTLGNIWNLSEGNYGEVVADFLLGNMTGAVKSFFARICVPLTVKSILNWGYEEAKKSWMGDAAIQISSVKRTSETTVTVEGQISEIYSIPLINIFIVDGMPEYEDNIVRYGVAVGRNSYPGLYLNDNCSELEVVGGLEDESKFSFTFYMEEVPGEVFYFRPFLIPESKLKGKNDLFPTPYTCIRYGEAKKFMDMSVELSNFKQVKCTKDGEGYNAQFTIDSKILGLFDDLQNWGIKVETESQKSDFLGGYRYYADKSGGYSLPTEMSFTCDVKIKEDDIEDSGEERIAKITITPFVEVGFNLENTFLEAEEFTISISGDACDDANHVHAVDLGLSVKWACCNVGADVPEGYGGYYAWGETEEKSNYIWSTYKYWSDKDGDGNVEEKEITNIGSNISGTSYDVAHVKWGGSWRMPTLDEIKELCNKCFWEWTTVNGVNGQKVTGPNGNSIFLPAAGYRYGKEVDYRGSYGFYWSGTLGEYYRDDAFHLYFGSGFRDWYDYGYYSRLLYGRPVRPVTE